MNFKSVNKNGYGKVTFGPHVWVTSADDAAHGQRVAEALNADPDAVAMGELLHEVAAGEPFKCWRGAAAALLKRGPDEVTEPAAAASLLWDKAKAVP